MFSWRFHLLRLLLACLFLSAFSPILFSANALAFKDPIAVTSQSDTLHFPQSIDFQMIAHAASSTITQATIYIMYASRGYQELHTVAANPPAATVTLRWHEAMTSDNFAPPGTPVTYYWRVQDSANNIHTDDPQKFQVTDTRFAWQHAIQGLLQVNWYNRTQDFGQAILGQASTNIKRISDNLGGGLQHPINLWVYQSNEDFHGALPPQSYEWVGGIAFPSLNQASIVADSLVNDTLRRDMPHELTHLILHQLIYQDTAPVWFDEGMAVYNQLYKEPALSNRLKAALVDHSLIPLLDISRYFPADSDKAYLAYAQSWNLVDYMFNTFGRNKMALLIKDMSNPQQDFGADLVQAMGIDLAHLENQWHLYLNQPATQPADQLTPTTHPTPQIQPSTVDSAEPLLILLGLLLTFLPMIGITGLLVYQRQARINNQLARQAQQIINSTLPPLSINNNLLYTNPGAYSAPPSPVASWSHPYRQEPIRSNNMHQPGGADTPWRFPAAIPSDYQGEQELTASPFTYNQEYINQPPDKRVSQE